MVTALLRLEYVAVDAVAASAAFHAAFGTGEVSIGAPVFSWEQLSLVDDGITASRIAAAGQAVRVRIDRSPELVVVSVREGAMEVDIGSAKAVLGPGALALVPIECSAELRWDHVHFEAFSIPPTSLARLLGAGAGPVRLLAPRLEPRSPTVARFVAHAAHLLTARVFASSEIYERDLIRSQAIDSLTAATIEAFDLANRSEEGTDRDTTTVRRAVGYMREHLAEPISIPDVAEAAGLSVRGLQLVFHRSLGTTPLMHLRQMRLEAARQTLRRQALRGTTVAEVARRFGYSNSGRFASHYRNEFGESPGSVLQAIRDERPAVAPDTRAVPEESASASGRRAVAD